MNSHIVTATEEAAGGASVAVEWPATRSVKRMCLKYHNSNMAKGGGGGGVAAKWVSQHECRLMPMGICLSPAFGQIPTKAQSKSHESGMSMFVAERVIQSTALWCTSKRQMCEQDDCSSMWAPS